VNATHDVLDEADLVRRARGGDQAAFGVLFRRHHPAALRVVHGIVRDEGLARDVCQDAWIAAWEKLPQFRGDAAFGTWIHAIAVRKALDALRRRRGWLERFVPFLRSGPDDAVAPEETLAAPLPDPAASAEEAELQRRFERALDALAPQHRAVLVLREVEGRSYEEIAAVLGIPPGTVMSRLFNARRHLARTWRTQPCD
jgi:RNA polymerase sigma-70 factor (ECF subfamily)